MDGKNNTMNKFQFGLVAQPLTPFLNGQIDWATYERVLQHQIHHQVDGLAISTHTGESVSLTIPERLEQMQFALKVADGKTPIVAYVSEAGTAIASEIAAKAASYGASALIACVPYYWTPPQSMLMEHFKAIGQAGNLPLFLYNSPVEMSGVKISTNMVLELINQLPNFAGVIDTSHDWQYMIELISEATRIKPDFQLISGTEYMVSASAIGATGLLSAMSNIAPQLTRSLFDTCAKNTYDVAYDDQVKAAVLWRLFHQFSLPGIKYAAQKCQRSNGQVRSPLTELTPDEKLQFDQVWQSFDWLSSEVSGF